MGGTYFALEYPREELAVIIVLFRIIAACGKTWDDHRSRDVEQRSAFAKSTRLSLALISLTSSYITPSPARSHPASPATCTAPQTWNTPLQTRHRSRPSVQPATLDALNPSKILGQAVFAPPDWVAEHIAAIPRPHARLPHPNPAQFVIFRGLTLCGQRQVICVGIPLCLLISSEPNAEVAIKLGCSPWMTLAAVSFIVVTPVARARGAVMLRFVALSYPALTSANTDIKNF